MRVAITVLALLLLVTACTNAVSGTAQRDPTPIPAVLSKDGSGIRIGSTEAPIQLEFYTEPQCRHCADVQADFGDKLAYYVATGQLAITYRPMVLLDKDNGKHSQRVADAMFAAVTGDTVTTSGPAFQRFVMKLFTAWDGGPNVPTVEEMAQMARGSGIPDEQVARIEAAQSTVDTADATDLNFEFLYMLDPLDTAMPYVYDLSKDRTLDVYDDNWLSKVMES
jgi:hypothetical protein